METVISYIVRIFAILVCITIHELAHGYTAYLLGDTTAKSQGRLSINPIAHIDPIGLVCMLVAGIGWAKPVPVNPSMFSIKNRKLGMAITALAGPGANMLTSFICFLFYIVLIGHFSNPFIIALSDVLFSVATLGLGLAVFNLIPIPPLDGSKVLMPFMPNSVIQWVWKNEGFIRFGFLALVMLGALDGVIGTMLGTLFNFMLKACVSLLSGIGII